MSLARIPLRSSPGAHFRQLVADALPAGSLRSTPLPILGTPNAYTALLAQHCGARALYLSGSSVSTVSLGLPDLGLLTAHDVATDTHRITSASTLPLLVDVDTGLSSSSLGIRRTIGLVESAGACGVHLEDQRIDLKRCGHRPGKAVVTADEMCARIAAAVSGRSDPAFVIMARTDALAEDPSLPRLLSRLRAYVRAGADMLFVEAARSLEQYAAVVRELRVPVLANVTEFGVGPLWSQRQLGEAGVSMALYPVSAQRAMAKAAEGVMRRVLQEGGVGEEGLQVMQTRAQLYDVLRYARYERMQEEAEAGLPMTGEPPRASTDAGPDRCTHSNTNSQ